MATAIGAAVLTAAVTLVPTDIIDTPWFIRAVPVRWWELPVALASSVLVGVWVLLGSGERSARARRQDKPGSRSAVAGTVLTLFAVGCPTCNKLVVLALGVSGALGVWAPWQPVLGVVSLLLLVVAVVVRLRTRARAYPVP